MDGKVPDNVYVCMAGHVTEADATDDAVRLILGVDSRFDYTKRCRRKNPAFTHETDGRCYEPVVPAREYPGLYSAFLIGGESAVADLVIQTVKVKTHG